MAQRGRLADGWNERNGPQVLAAFKPVVADADKCTVRVYCDGKETVLGTVVGSDGWIATKYSELHDPIVCRLPDGKQLPAKLVGLRSALRPGNAEDRRQGFENGRLVGR